MPKNVSAYNLATGNKWILSIPTKFIDPDIQLSTFAMNIHGFDMPELSIATVNFGLGGVNFPLPGKVRDEDKTITVYYKPSARYEQFHFLYKWFSQIANECGTSNSNPLTYTNNIDLTFLTEYKNPTFSFTFHGAWLVNIPKLPLDYQTDGETLYHSFSFKYAYYTKNTLKNA